MVIQIRVVVKLEEKTTKKNDTINLSFLIYVNIASFRKTLLKQYVSSEAVDHTISFKDSYSLSLAVTL